MLTFVRQSAIVPAMAKNVTIAVRLEEAIKAAIERASQDDKRSLSSKVAVVLEEWLRANGYLKEGRKR